MQHNQKAVNQFQNPEKEEGGQASTVVTKAILLAKQLWSKQNYDIPIFSHTNLLVLKYSCSFTVADQF